MAKRIMFVQLKTGFGTDQGPCWICLVDFTRSWQTARFHGRTLHRSQGVSGNFADVDTDEEWWISGPKRDMTDARYSNQQPTIDDDVREAYEAFLDGAPLPGRETG